MSIVEKLSLHGVNEFITNNLSTIKHFYKHDETIDNPDNDNLNELYTVLSNKKKEISIPIWEKYIFKNDHITYNEKILLNDFFSFEIKIENMEENDTFLYSILYALFPSFQISNEKENEILEMRKQLASDLENKNLYKNFGYNRKQAFNKSNMQYILMDMREIFGEHNTLKQYFADYFNLSILVFENNGGYYDIKENYMCDSNKYLFLIYQSGKYYSILDKDDIGVFMKDEPKMQKIINFLKQRNDAFENSFTELKKKCEYIGIELKKFSDKSNRMVMKKKEELIIDFIKYLNNLK